MTAQHTSSWTLPVLVAWMTACGPAGRDGTTPLGPTPVDASVASADAAPADAGPTSAAGRGRNETRVFARQIKNEQDWATYSRTFGSDTFGKYVLDLKTDEIYYFDVNVYRMHTDFVFQVIYKKPVTNDALIEFVKNYDAHKPRFVLGYVTHHLKVDEWTFSFWEGDAIRPADLQRARQKLIASFYRGRTLKFRPDSPAQEQLVGQLKDVPTITNDKIYKTSDYQSFNHGTATGVLRVVPPGTPYESLVYERNQIVVLQAIYPDITPVAGIVSTEFSTPLSHVNLRARLWDIPNAGIKGAGAKFAALDGKVVVFEVREADYTLRAATAAETKKWRERKKVERTVKVPRADLKTKELRSLETMRASDIKTYGAKASNLGEIVNAKLPGVNVPPGFGIPIYYYAQHMKQSGLDKQVAKMLADPRWKTDAAYRKHICDGLRAKIEAAPIDGSLLDAVWAKVEKDLGGQGVFVRSSTNVEDLEGFNGAGLYDTVANVKGKEALGAAIKHVWASLWKVTAVEERSLFGIDDHGAYASVFVQVGMNAEAAGVLITTNMFDPEDKNSYTINAKRGLGLRVVAGTTIPEQILFDTSNNGTKIISRSDDPTMLVFDERSGGLKEVPNDNKGVILTEYRAYTLAMVAKKIWPLFEWSKRYPADIEWLFIGDQVWIVQSRPYMSH